MKNRTSNTVIALALAGAATTAFATNKDPRKDCFESPQYPQGTPACHTPPTPPVKPPVTPAPAPVTQTTNVEQNTAVGVGVKVPVHVTTGPTNVSAPVHVSAPTNVVTGPTNVTTGPTNVTTGPTNVTTGPTTVNDNGVTTQTTTLAPTTTSEAQGGAGGSVNINNRPAASTAMGIAPSKVNSECERSIEFGLGVQSLDHGTSLSVGIPIGQSKDCSLDKKWTELARSPNDVDQALKHQIGAAKHPEYRAALGQIDANVGAMVEANGGKPVTIQPGESHRLLGGNLQYLTVKPIVVTVEKIITAPAPAAAAQGCTFNLNQHFEYGKATYTAKKTGAPLPPAPAASTCTLAELEKAQKAGFEAGQKATAPAPALK